MRRALALVQAGVPAAAAGRLDPDRPGQARTWHPSRSQPSVPSGPRARVEANIAALRTLAELQTGDQPATQAQQQVLAGWSSWGAVPKVFDETDPTWAGARTELRNLLTEQQWSAASRTTINAHYTDPAIASAMWANLVALGFTDGQVLEPPPRSMGPPPDVLRAPRYQNLLSAKLAQQRGIRAPRVQPCVTS